MRPAAHATPRAVESPTVRWRRCDARTRDARLRRRSACSVSPRCDASARDADSDAVRLLEFYSGSGMMRWALQNAVGPRREVIGVAAIDNSEVANAVYSANFPRPEPLRRNVEHITREQIERDFCAADVWTASPPCQPYTRKGNEKHDLDPRAASFLKLLEIFPTVREACKPKCVLVENVVGFENSATRDALVETLAGEYRIEEFVGASPMRLGVPNTRERYYLLAKRKELGAFPDAPNAALPFPRFGESDEADEKRKQEPPRETRAVGTYLRRAVPETTARSSRDSASGASLAVPASAIEKYWRWFDVVTPMSLGSQCFTAGYGKTVFGGSVLAAEAFANDPEFCELTNAEQKRYKLLKPPPPNALRYFAPEEIAALHGLESASVGNLSGPKFELPENLTRRQLYFTLGNSVSVDVVQELMRYLMQDVDDRG